MIVKEIIAMWLNTSYATDEMTGAYLRMVEELPAVFILCILLLPKVFSVIAVIVSFSE